jgi:hypothetical protein
MINLLTFRRIRLSVPSVGCVPFTKLSYLNRILNGFYKLNLYMVGHIFILIDPRNYIPSIRTR